MSRLAIDTIWVFFVNLACILINTLTLVVLANHLGARGFGMFSLALAVGGIASQVAGLGMECVIVMNCSRDPGRLEAELGNAIAVRTIASLLLLTSVLVWVWATGVAGEMAVTIMVVTASLSLATMANPLLTSVFRTIGDIRLPWAFLFGQSSLFCIGVFLAKSRGMGVTGVSWVHLATSALLFASLLSRFLLRFRPRLNRRIMRENFWLGIVFNANQSVSMLRAAAGQLVLQFMGASQALGEYAVGLRVSNGLNVLPSAIQTVCLPSLHAAQTLDRQVALFAVLFRFTLISGGLVAGLVFWAADDVVHILFSNEYVRSQVVLRVLAVAVFLNFLSYPYSMLAEAVRKVGQRCVAQAVSAVIAFASGLCFARWLGSVGVALGDCVAFASLLAQYNAIVGHAPLRALRARHTAGVLLAIATASGCTWVVRTAVPQSVGRLVCATVTYAVAYVAVCLASKSVTRADLVIGRLSGSQGLLATRGAENVSGVSNRGPRSR